MDSKYDVVIFKLASASVEMTKASQNNNRCSGAEKGACQVKMTYTVAAAVFANKTKTVLGLDRMPRLSNPRDALKITCRASQPSYRLDLRWSRVVLAPKSLFRRKNKIKIKLRPKKKVLLSTIENRLKLRIKM